MKSISNRLTNLEISRLFRKIAAAYTILGENRFKIIAYDNAATAVEHATSEIKDLWDENKLDSVPGLGPSIIGHLNELFSTGRSKHFDALLSKINPAVFPLLNVPGIGPKKAEKLVEELNIKDAQKVFTQLESAARKHEISKIDTFGQESEQRLLESLMRFKKGSVKEKRMPLPLADAIADEIIFHLQGSLNKSIHRLDKLGSLRRQVSTIGDIDLAVSSDHPQLVLKTFINFPKKVGVVEKGPQGATLLLASGRQCDLRVSSPDSYGAMLQYFTGSKYHNIRLRDFALKKNLSLNEYGIKKLAKNEVSRIIKFSSEESFYKYLGLDFIPPELREDTGEIDAALHHALPELIELIDVKGDLQMHSNFDLQTSHDSGINSIVQLKQAGLLLGYDYIGITNHNPSTSKHSHVQILSKIKSQTSEIEHINSTGSGPRVLNLLEVDILPSGELSVPNDGLAILDGCLVSIHSNFQMTKEKMTNRVLKALSHPVARILAHPTGRLLQQREGYELDWDKIFLFCIKKDKALEINAYPNRLDLPDILVRQAVKKGVKLSLGTDSHQKEDLINMKFGVSVARRGWAEKKDIINTWGYNEIINWMQKRT